jgi:hypothetical protein
LVQLNVYNINTLYFTILIVFEKADNFSERV